MSVPPTTYTPRLIRTRLPKLCIAVTGDDPGEMVEKAEVLARDYPLLEFRLDYLKAPAPGLPKLKKFLDMHPEVTAIATCRRATNGGKFRGTAQAQFAILLKATGCGFQMVDVELETAEALKRQDLEKLRASGFLILSHHDFKQTKRLQETFGRMREHPGDIYKIVTTATSLYDNVAMMKFLQEHSDRFQMIGLCMGEQGIISRVLGLRAGSVFTFAAATPAEATAPGQISAKELRDIYRIEQVDAATRVYGVAGDPVSQSLSPIMLNAAFRREAVNAVFLALHAKKLDDVVACTQNIPIQGLSVTMPYKQEMVAELDNSDPLTQKVGACNTVVRSNDAKLYGFNTDVGGIIGPLEQKITIADAKVLVLGAGGAARAAVFGLKARGAEVFILNRTAANAQKLARQAGAKIIKRTDLGKLSFDAIINATPVGMANPKNSPLEQKEIRAKVVFDLVYNPMETRLMKLAQQAGASIISGVEMFVTQGARQFEIWTGKPAPMDEMRYVVVRELERRAAEEAINGEKNGKAKKK
jgi:3-dehydroquinate dehydratase / shikimate dehydrogenase